MFSGVLFVTARFESFDSRVEIAGLPAEHRGLLERLEDDGRTRDHGSRRAAGRHRDRVPVSKSRIACSPANSTPP